MVRAVLKAKAKRRLLEGNKAATAAAAPADEGRGGPAPPKHIQRKLTRKVKFLERVAATKLTAAKGGVAKKKKKTPSKALTDLASLTASLNEAAAGALQSGGGDGGARRRQFGASVGTQRGRERVAEVETARLQQVLDHPQFRANPLAAVASHLAATLPPPPSKPLPGEQQKDAATLRREKKKRRKQRAKEDAAMGDD